MVDITRYAARNDANRGNTVTIVLFFDRSQYTAQAAGIKAPVSSLLKKQSGAMLTLV